MNDIFSSITQSGAKGMVGVLEATKQLAASQGRTSHAAKLASNIVSMESIDITAKTELNTAVSQLHASLEGICQSNLQVDKKSGKANVSQAQMQAALYAGIMGGDIGAAVKAPIKSNVIAQEGISVVEADSVGLDNRRAALEAYDEQSTSTTVAFSIAYNLAAARQDEFGEALFPTVVIPPDQAGMMMTIDLVMLQNDAKHQTSGAVEDFRRSNVIRALTYPTLLQNDATNIIPVFRDGVNEDYFVPSTDMAPVNITMDNGESIQTSALAMGTEFDLLGLSQTDALLQAGVMDVTDSVDPGVTLKELFLQLTNADGSTKEVVRFNTMDLPLSNFNYAVQGNYKDMVLNFDTNVLTVNKDTVKYDNGVSTLLAPIVAGQYEVRLGIVVSGKMNVQFGTTTAFTNKLQVVSVRQNGVNLDTKTGTGKTIADIFKGAEFIGYNLDAKRSNMNRRQRGQLVDTTTYRQYYKLNLLSPITVPRPHSAGDANDARDLNALIFTTHVRTSNAAVDKLLATADILKSIVGTQARAGDTIEVLGLARWLVDPQFDDRTYDAPAVIDSVKSHERAADIQASLVNMIRDMAYEMYQNSGYKPAADSQNGGMSAPPTVIIATDQEIARYLTVTGDLRTLGDHFPVKIVSTTNIKMRGKIFVTFGDFTTAEAGVPNVLHFGTMQYRPELTVVLPTARDGSYSKEITVSPSFRHHVNLPVLGRITVTGISDVVDSKLPINMHSV